jgi:integrase
MRASMIVTRSIVDREAGRGNRIRTDDLEYPNLFKVYFVPVQIVSTRPENPCKTGANPFPIISVGSITLRDFWTQSGPNGLRPCLSRRLRRPSYSICDRPQVACSSSETPTPAASHCACSRRAARLGHSDIVPRTAAAANDSPWANTPLWASQRPAGAQIVTGVRFSDGGDPAAERRAQRDAATVGSLADRYMAQEIEPARKPATVALYRKYLNNHIRPAIGSKRARDVAYTDIAKLHRAIGAKAPVTANRVASLVGSLFRWAAKAGELPRGHENPARDVTRYKEQPRERYLNTGEWARLGDALREAETVGLPWEIDSRKPTAKHAPRPENRRAIFSPAPIAAIRLLLLTGCRVGEILKLRWPEIDFDRGLMLLPDSKTGRKPVILNSPALQVLSTLPRIGTFVIAGDDPGKPRADLNRPWRAIAKRAQLDGVRLHDLRHSFASVGAGLGLGLPIVGKLLGHTAPTTTARYAHLDANPLRRASDRIGETIANALGDPLPRADVLPMRWR